MSFLPERTILGQLEIIEVYDFYDKPVLFSCKNKSGLTFIVVCVDSSDFAEIWLYAPVSSSRFQSVIKGDVELRHIFAETEDAFVYQVEIPYEDEINVIVKNIECNQIPDDYLPELGQFIQSEFQNIENIEVVSTQKRREILDFVLKFPDKDIQEAPVGDLGLILSSLQETIDAIGQIKSGKSESHIIPFEIKQKTQVVMSGVFSGSFGIRLEGTVYEEDSLGLGESFLGQCFKEFIQLINLGANSEELPAKLNILKKKTAFKYTEFLIALTRIGISKLHINWASPGQKVQVGEIEQETISKVIDVINNTKLRAETEICVKVKLTQINYNTRTTTLQEVGSRKKYKCSIADSAIKDVKSIEEDSVYVATIQEYAIVSTVLNKEKHEYELLSLKLEAESENTQA
ncbi:hypothetical protein PN497_04490 [Sphaerospermopsis kisseleviana CS-549]|uniref:DUF6575 domain-containing protein n=1 Tax=Sphaerospermopsis kisseleviana CS-549 TaxID=3021783 RepID=A0ABT4ZML2_9CYAN|nr:DUF6575 domain-containing protein [Sphaerospermopsis kisseleviana]MDB9440622.1 hypothetical protein [Sphaerospermopsis kisseleviana CS-549]BAZ83161.1 hypothetical protein NIES73_44480 [Sphaerospermopsis kisseleviana NIES-73]